MEPARLGARTKALGLALAVLAICRGAFGQEMPGKGMTCWDKRELCDLNCVFSTTHEGTNKLTACSTGCVEEQRACTDSDETVEYIACATGCAYTYDSDLIKCNQQTSAETKATYGTNQDACANLASGVMDDCMETCYGSDRFNGWTPDKEEGYVVEGMENEIWRRPFRAKETIYGRLRGEQSA